MGTTYATRREFCRRLFRVGGATAQLRHAFLDGLSDSAIQAQQTGSAISASSANGASVQFQFFTGWAPSDALALIDEARTWADCSDAGTALALVRDDVTSYRFRFSGAGGFA